MGSIGPLEILVVLVVALLVLGPQKLPDAARSLGRAIGEVRRYTAGFQNEMRDAFAEPPLVASPPPEVPSETPAVSDVPAVSDTKVGEAPPAVEPASGNGDTPSA